METSLPGLARHPRVQLSHRPTPLEPAPRLGEKLGVNLWIKRDDCTGLAMGGNKARQLEYYFGQAVEANADTVLITGAVQSNFVRMAAAAARRLGMEIHIQLEERVKTNNATYKTSGNVFLNRLMGAHLSHFPVGEDEAAADASLDEKARALQAEGKQPFVIHLGLDSAPIGALGYVAVAEELLGQFESGEFVPDAVVVASGSALTHCGLLVGFRALGSGLPVYGACVRRPKAEQTERVCQRSREVAALLDVPWGEQAGAVGGDDDVLITDATYGPSYGKLNPPTAQAIKDAAELEGLIVDPVYTGKSLAAVGALIESGELSHGQNVLFVHTGGHPSVFAYQPDIEQWLESEG